MTEGPISSGRKLVTGGLLVVVAVLGLNVGFSEAAGQLTPVYDWTELSPPQAPAATHDGSSAFDEAGGEMVYFGNVSGET